MLMKNFNSFFNQLTAMPKRLAMVLTVLFTICVGQVWAEETIIYTLDGTTTGGSNNYAEASDITQNNVSWSVVGNTTMSPWRIGGKSLTSTDRTIASITSIASNISKVVVSHGTASSVTVNSLKLIVASDANFSNVVSTVTGKFTASSTTEFTCPNNADWTNMYYKFVYNITISNTSNKYLEFNSATFYGEESQTGGGSTPEPGNEETGTINFNSGSNAVKISKASVTGEDNLGKIWTITTEGTSYYSNSTTYSQVGSSSNPATSITFTTTLPSNVNVTAFSAKFGGFSGTAGTVTLKVDGVSVGTGALNASNDITITNTKEATGKTLTVTVTGISKGVKAYYISYTYESVIFVQTYTLTNQVSPAEYGTVLPSSVAGIPEGTTTTSSSNTYTVNGTTVTATPTTATAQYTYAFSEWQNLPATVNGDATVTAVFTRTTNKYTITWKNGDNVLETDNNVEYGATPQYNGATPTKAATAQYTYTHNGWTPSVVAVTGNAEYTATFAETPRTYTITLNTNGGTINAGNVTSYKYGAGATLPTNVTKEHHQFGGWFDNSGCTGTAVTTISTTATGDKEYWAKWTELPKYTVTWSVDGNTTTEEVYSGKKPTMAPEIDPANLPCDGADKFVGWTTSEYKGDTKPGTLYPTANDIPAITGDITFYAVFADYK